MNKINKHILLTMLALLAIPAGATTYYVSNAGSDSNAGTSPQLPWQTIAHVNRFMFAAGDTILLKRGDLWREQLIVPLSGTSGNPVTFGAYGDGPKPIIKASDLVTGWTIQTAPNIWKATYSSNTVNQVFRNAQRMRKMSSLAALVADNQWFFDGRTTLYVYSLINPNSATMEASNRDWCVRLINRSFIIVDSLDLRHANASVDGGLSIYASIPVSNHTIKNVDVSYASGYGILFYADTNGSFTTINVTDSTISRSGANPDGVQCLTFAIGPLPSGPFTNVTVTGGRYSYQGIHDDPNVPPIASVGIEISKVINGRFTDIEVDHNASSGITVDQGSRNITITGGSVHNNGGAGDANGIGIGGGGPASTDIVISGVDIYGNSRSGIEVSSTSFGDVPSNITIKNCRIRDTSGFGGNSQDGTSGGIHIGARSLGNVIMYNLIYNNRDSGLWFVEGVSGSPTAQVYGNVIWGNVVGGTQAGNAGVWLNGRARVTFKNNLVGNNGAWEVFMDTPGAVFTSDYNDWFHSTGGKFMSWFGTTRGDPRGYDLSGWQVASGQDFHSMSTDPLVQSDTNADFRPTESSPLINQGTTLGAPYNFGLDPRGAFPYATLDQSLFGTGYEIGAFVYTPYTPGFVSAEFNSLQKRRARATRR